MVYQKYIVIVFLFIFLISCIIGCANTDISLNKGDFTNNNDDTIMPEPTIRSIIKGTELKATDLVSSLEKLFICDLKKINHIKVYNPNKIDGEKSYSMKDGKYIIYTSMFWSRVKDLSVIYEPLKKLPENKTDMCTYWFMEDKKVLFYIYGYENSNFIYASNDMKSYKIELDNEKFSYITKYKVEPIVS